MYFQASDVKKKVKEFSYVEREALELVIHKDPFLFNMLGHWPSEH